MRRTSFILGALLTGALTISACVIGEGPITSETRDVRAFSQIEVGAGIQVSLSIGPAQPLEVRAQANVLPEIATEVEGNILKVDANGDFTSAEAVTVVVIAPGLERISLSGGAHATISGLDATSIEVEAKGGSAVTIVGASDEVVLRADGGATADLAELSARTVDLTLDGGAVASVAVSDRISGTASGGSQLTIHGDPRGTVQTSGGAEVLHD